ncbi:MAG: hypothetical protein LLG40_11215 [Deltaproteobacteria bacterium]|nr:hypothetical protein [Deltaproteobacteria bacterium]
MKRFSLRNIAALLMVFVMFVVITMPAQAAVHFTQKFARFSATAGETVAEGDVVTIKDADGYAYLADANDAALRPAVGVVGKGGASGATIEIVTYGVITGYTTLTESGPGYLSETAGDITQSSPTWSQQVGFAISATTYVINCQNYLDTSSLTAIGTLAGASPIIMEGATANAFETTIAVTDPTADRTITIPDRTGHVQLGSAASALTPAAAVALTVGLSDLYTDTVTDNEDQTITFSGAGSAGDEITIVFTTAGTADEVITFHATLVSSTGTLTLGTDAGKFYVIKFKSNGTHWYEVSRTAVQT